MVAERNTGGIGWTRRGCASRSSADLFPLKSSRKRSPTRDRRALDRDPRLVEVPALRRPLAELDQGLYGTEFSRRLARPVGRRQGISADPLDRICALRG